MTDQQGIGYKGPEFDYTQIRKMAKPNPVSQASPGALHFYFSMSLPSLITLLNSQGICLYLYHSHGKYCRKFKSTEYQKCHIG